MVETTEPCLKRNLDDLSSEKALQEMKGREIEKEKSGTEKSNGKMAGDEETMESRKILERQNGKHDLISRRRQRSHDDSSSDETERRKRGSERDRSKGEYEENAWRRNLDRWVKSREDSGARRRRRSDDSCSDDENRKKKYRHHLDRSMLRTHERVRKPERERDRDRGSERMFVQRDKYGRIVYRRGLRELEMAREIRRKEREADIRCPSSKDKPEEIKKGKSAEEKARNYQLEVLEQAKVKNTIAFLETGAGKTLIAVMLMKSKYEDMRKQKKKMLAVFLVPKVPLVYQQAEAIREWTDFHVGHYCGEMGQDFWDSRRWQREFDTREVLVMTAQILLNILRHSIIKMEAIHLLILDECHHAVKKHPYSLVMSEFYHMTHKERRPAVFGMTASPVNLKGVSSQEDCAIKMQNLESKLDSIVCTIKDRKELEKHVPMPLETVVEYDKAASLVSLREKIDQMQFAVEKEASTSIKRSKWQLMGARDAGAKEELKLVYGVSERKESDGAANLVQKLRAIAYSLDELGQWCAYQVALSYYSAIKNDERANRQLDVKFQESYLKDLVSLLKCELTEGAASAGKDDEDECPKCDIPKEEDIEEGELADTQVVSSGEHVDQILGAAVADGKVTPKVQSLIKILLRYQHTEDFRAIIFVERVVSAHVLPKVFAELPSLKFVKCASLIGHNNNQDMRTRQMQETITKFKDGKVTLLVATSVAEEGLDIRQCNVVIRFDLAKTVLAYMQSRGRARKPGSDYILMLERDNLIHQAFLRNARNSEETLRKEAIERTDISHLKGSWKLISSESASGTIYQVESTGAIVSLNSAVGLIHFFCSQLPTDRYSILHPEFRMQKHDKADGTTEYSCELELPCNAPFERIVGPVCNSMKLAQQYVCLEACKKLHEMGAITDFLLPDTWKSGEQGDLEAGDDGEPLPGTARHREFYPEGIPEILKGEWILTNKESACQLKSFRLFMYKVATQNIGTTKDPLIMQTSSFAILFGQELDSEVLSLSLDLFIARTLTTKCHLEFCSILEVSHDQLLELKAFHVRLMSIVLDIDVEPWRTPWDPARAYLFVPLPDAVPGCPLEIDWGLIKETLVTDAWSNPLQRARPDVFLGTNERALGGDRREYAFGKLRMNMLAGRAAHPTYGKRGAVAEYDVVKAFGLVLSHDLKEAECSLPEDGILVMADGEFMSVSELSGKIVTAAHSGRRFYIDSVRFEMNSESPFPKKEGYLGSLEYASYADYYKQKYGVDLVFKKQPLIRARGVSHCKNLLSPRFESSQGGAEENHDKTYYVLLPPELCLVHPLPGRLIRGAQRLPSIMRRVESMLLAIQLKNKINYPIPASSVLEALTAASCQETFSYERAELLGDAYLKWVVSRWLFLDFPQKHEGQLTRMRQQNVSNVVLYQKALNKGLQSYIQADRFAPSRWSAPGVPPVFDEDTKDGADLLPERANGNGTHHSPMEMETDMEIEEETEKRVETVMSLIEEVEIEQEDDDLSLFEDGEIEGDSSCYRVLSSKTLADVVEALIGVYYVKGGQDAASHFMEWIGIPSKFESCNAEDAQRGCVLPDAVARSIDFEGLEKAIGYNFRHKGLLVEAITHASRPASSVPCYQRLEFVGDAVLDHLITRHLFFSYSDLPPGRLTDLRAAAVNNERFARVAVKHNLHLHLRHGSSALETQIRDFVEDIEGEIDKPAVNSFGLADFKAPKVLGDIIESVAGAIFLDQCLDTDAVWKVFEPLLQPMVTPETLPMHPVRELQERCQKQAEGLEYKTSRAGNVATVEVFVDGVQIGIAHNSQKKMAQKLAARNALIVLKEKDETQHMENANGGGDEDGKNGDYRKDPSQTFIRQTLNDICLRKQWPMPQYKCVAESGPAHAKRFTYSVRINTNEKGWTEECVGDAMPSVKKSKDSAAQVLLQFLKQHY